MILGVRDVLLHDGLDLALALHHPISKLWIAVVDAITDILHRHLLQIRLLQQTVNVQLQLRRRRRPRFIFRLGLVRAVGLRRGLGARAFPADLLEQALGGGAEALSAVAVGEAMRGLEDFGFGLGGFGARGVGALFRLVGFRPGREQSETALSEHTWHLIQGKN